MNVRKVRAEELDEVTIETVHQGVPGYWPTVLKVQVRWRLWLGWSSDILTEEETLPNESSSWHENNARSFRNTYRYDEAIQRAVSDLNDRILITARNLQDLLE